MAIWPFMIPQFTTLRGTLHKEYDVPNQDAVISKVIAGYDCAAVCDGVSLKSDWTFSNSEIASAICAQCAIDYLEDHLKASLPSSEVSKLIEGAFQYTSKTLKERLDQKGLDELDCQTTMILMVLRKGILYGGIAGDGGILYQTKAGRTSMMVTQLKTTSAVFPIRCHEEWRFFQAGSELDPVVKAIAATDGVFDQLIFLKDGQIQSNIEQIESLFAIGSLPQKQRKKWLRQTIEALPGHDDKTIAIFSQPSKAL